MVHIFNDKGELLVIDDIIGYLSIQLEKEDIVKVYSLNLYWDAYLLGFNIGIDKGFIDGDKYTQSKEVRETIETIKDFLSVNWGVSDDELKDIKEKVKRILSGEGFDEVLNEINFK